MMCVVAKNQISQSHPVRPLTPIIFFERRANLWQGPPDALFVGGGPLFLVRRNELCR